MSADEIALVSRRYRERIESLLTPEQLARFDAYEQRVQAALAHPRCHTGASNRRRAGCARRTGRRYASRSSLRKQLDILLRSGLPPQ